MQFTLFCKPNPSLVEFVIIAKRCSLPNGLDHMSLILLKGVRRDMQKQRCDLLLKDIAIQQLWLSYIGQMLTYITIYPAFICDEDMGHYIPLFALVRATDRTYIRVRCVDVSEMQEAVLTAYIIIKGSKV